MFLSLKKIGKKIEKGSLLVICFAITEFSVEQNNIT